MNSVIILATTVEAVWVLGEAGGAARWTRKSAPAWRFDCNITKNFACYRDHLGSFGLKVKRSGSKMNSEVQKVQNGVEQKSRYHHGQNYY